MDEFKIFIKNNNLELAQDDIDDKTFMAICGILVINNNKALSPLEIAHELQSRNWNGFSGTAPATTIANHIRNHSRRRNESANLIRKHKLTGTKLDEKILPYIGNRANKGVVYFLNGALTGYKSPWEAAGVNDPYAPATSSSTPSSASDSKSSSSNKRRSSERINQPRKSRRSEVFPLSPAQSDNEEKPPTRRLRSNHVVNDDDVKDVSNVENVRSSKHDDGLEDVKNIKLEQTVVKPEPFEPSEISIEEVVDKQEVEKSLLQAPAEFPTRPPSPAQSEREDEDDFHISMMSPSAETLPAVEKDEIESKNDNSNQTNKTNDIANLSSLEKELDELSPISNEMDCVESKDNDFICNLATPPLSPKLLINEDLPVDALDEIDTIWTEQVDYRQRRQSAINKTLLNSLDYVESIRAAARQ
ncbi:hypothetical protein E3Q19_00537 [Wallemia mellicola]|nr:hypothetical protein E3Q19_00537 [Wallemia mellicola]